MSNQSPFVATSSSSTPATVPSTKKRRGFAAMDPAVVRVLARKGGIAAHVAGTAHEFNGDEARAAGRKGGLAAHESKEGTSPAPPESQPS